MKIVIVAFHFAPDEAIGAIRPENWAEWLSDEHDVVVITRAQPQKESAYAGDFKVVQTHSFFLRLVEKLNLWRKKRREHKAKQTVSKTPSQISNTPVVAGQTSSGMLSYRMPCLYDFWFWSAYRKVVQEKPDVIIATHSPYVGLVIGYFASLKTKAKLWADFRDLWTGNPLVTGVKGVRSVERFLENRILKQASVITTVSHKLADWLKATKTQASIEVIYNSPKTILSHTSMKKEAPFHLNFCYTGTLYAGWRDPSPLLEFLAERKIQGLPTSCSFTVASRATGNLFDLVDRYNVQEYLDFKGSVSRAVSQELQIQADILVLLESGLSSGNGNLTGKMFEYLATDKPILLLGPGPESEIYKLLDAHGRLITLPQVAALLDEQKKPDALEIIDYSEISRKKVLDIANTLL